MVELENQFENGQLCTSSNHQISPAEIGFDRDKNSASTKISKMGLHNVYSYQKKI